MSEYFNIFTYARQVLLTANFSLPEPSLNDIILLF